ncbi:phage tail protein [Andreprevotia chitinilytica]|uniref:phage tail protein n=1 Tax=Andreprevotia chitinilytica TaxID=396808 RepID=UPI00054EF675|nr:tail fiber protein [Andreprevotia chitinilytica]
MEQYLGEIRMCAFSIAPRGWAFCMGQLLSIQANTALFSLLGTKYGGNGTSNFALPDLRGRTPVHRDQAGNYVQGAMGGVETVQLAPAEMPQHNHIFNLSSANATLPNVGNTENHLLAVSHVTTGSGGAGQNLYATAVPNTLTALSNEACGSTGSSQPHENMQPSLVMNYIIATTGIYPSRN